MKIIYVTGAGATAGAYCLDALACICKRNNDELLVIMGKSPKKKLTHYFNSVASIKNTIRKTLNLIGVLAKPHFNEIHTISPIDIVRKHKLEHYYFIQMNDIAYNLCSKYNPNVIISSFNPLILEKRFIDLPRIGCINIHPSLLPKYAGVDVYNRQIENNEKKSGVTIHHIVERIDAGDIILQKAIPVLPYCSPSRLSEKLACLAKSMIPELYEMLLTGELPHIKQDLSKRTYYSYPTPKNKKSNPAESNTLLNKIKKAMWISLSIVIYTMGYSLSMRYMAMKEAIECLY